MSLFLDDTTRSFLDANRYHYELLIGSGYIKHLDGATREGLLRAAQKFSPGYLADLWCSECVADMIRRTYVWYDKWIASQPT